MFINPLILSGLAAVSIPIIIHLLNRRKFERVVWAAMRFLKVSIEQNQRRIQVEDILLLILRCLLVALLVLALARPVLHAVSLGGETAVSAVIVLDNSYSMSQTDGVEPRFVSAKKAADDVLKNLPAGSSAAVILASDKPVYLIQQFTHDMTFAGSNIKDAPLYDRGSNLYPSIKAGIERLMLESNPRKELYVITDGQASAFRQMMDVQNLLEQHKKELRAHLLFVGKAEEKNIGITGLRFSQGITAINQPLRVEIRVKNYGKAEHKDLNVSISVDNDPPMDQTTVEKIAGGEETGVTLFARFKSEGYHTITAKIDPDHLPADDTRTIAVRAVKDVKVLLVDGDPGRDWRDSEMLFLKAALRPVPRTEWDDYFVKLITRTPTELDGMQLEDYDAVIAANVTDFAPNVVNHLVNYARGGGALMFFLGDNINVGFYNNELFEKTSLLPAKLGETRGDAKSEKDFFSFSERSTDHEITSRWKDPGQGSLTTAKFFKAFRLIPDDRKAGGNTPEKGRTILSFNDNSPAMVERNFGFGRVILFASTAKTSWNDMPARGGIMVPLMNRTLDYLLKRKDANLNIPVGGAFVYSNVTGQGRDATITKRARGWSDTAKDLMEINERRKVELVNGAYSVSFGQDGEVNFAGGYEVKIPENPTVRFAAQSEPEESELEPLSEDQMLRLGDQAHIVRWTPGASLADTLTQARVGTEITMWIAAMALVLATAETLAAHWFSKSK